MLPSQNIPWPPEIWRPVYDKYAEHAAWYSADPAQLMAVYQSRVAVPTRKGRIWTRQVQDDFATRLHVPVALDIATTSADLLFSERPAVKIPEAHGERASGDAKQAQARLDEIIQRGAVFSRLIEAGQSAAALGGVFLRPVWDRGVADIPLLAVTQADNAVPEFRWGTMTAATFWRELDHDGQKVLRHLERHEPGIIYHGLYLGTIDKLGYQINLQEHPETAGLVPEIITNIPGLAVRYVPNTLPNNQFRGWPIGKSDYAGAEGLMDALDEVYSSWIRDVQLALSRLFVAEELLDLQDDKLQFGLEKAAYVALNMDPASIKETGGLQIHQFDIRHDAHRATALELLDRIISTAGYSPQSFGLKIEGSAESGTALRIRERKSLITKQKKESYFGPALADVLEMMMIVDRTILGGSATPYRPSVEFADSISFDLAETAQAVDVLSRAEAVSTITKVRMTHPDWTAAEVQAEAERIVKERGLAVPDPIQNRVW